MKLYAIKTEIINICEDLVEAALEALKKQNLQLDDNDVLAVTSKAIAYAEGRLINLHYVKPSNKAMAFARQFSLEPEFAELMLREAEKIYGGVEKAVLTLKKGILTPNAGIDSKNAPEGHVILWPVNPQNWAKKIREEIKERTGKKIAVLIVDSSLVPLRRGTMGLALAVAGFKPVRDLRGKMDLFGKKIRITQHAVADNLASAAHILMGEDAEKIPIVLIKDAPVDFDDGVYGSADMTVPFKECIFMNAFLNQIQK